MKAGHTQAMIAELIASVREGQPRSIVVAHTEAFAQYIRDRVACELDRAGLDMDACRHQDMIYVEGSTIQFVGVQRIERVGRGSRGVGYFVDHTVYDQAKDRHNYYLECLETLIQRQEQQIWRPQPYPTT